MFKKIKESNKTETIMVKESEELDTPAQIECNHKAYSFMKDSSGQWVVVLIKFDLDSGVVSSIEKAFSDVNRLHMMERFKIEIANNLLKL